MGKSGASFTLETVERNALSNVDFVATAKQGMFIKGTPSGTTQLVYVSFLNDNSDEDDEVFDVCLTSVGGATLTEWGSLATVTILDDDAPPTLTVSDPVVNELSQLARFTVTLSTPSGRWVGFDHTTADQTAKGGLDYTARSGPIWLEPNTASYDIDVTVADDSVAEPTQTFAVNLSAATNATIADYGLGTILDNERARAPIDLTYLGLYFADANSASNSPITCSSTTPIPWA